MYKSQMHSMYIKPLLLAIGLSLISIAILYFALSSLLSPALLLVLGVITTILIISLCAHYFIISPMYSCMQNFVRKAQGEEDLNSAHASVSEEQLKNHCHLGGVYSSISDTLGSFYHMARKLVDNSSHIAIVAAEVSFAAEGLSKKVHSEVKDINHIANSAKNISDVVNESAQNANTAAQCVTQMRDTSQDGQEIVEKAIKLMHETDTQAKTTSEIVAKLESKSEQIKGITAVINGIAEQTNLLALNAAIEAARAGEQGRGFAVVADEVRVLAHKTSDATHEIGLTIDEIALDVQNAVDTMKILVEGIAAGTQSTETIGNQLKDLHHQAEQIHEQIGVIAKGSEINANEVEEISKAIGSVSGHLSHTESEITHVVSQAQGLSEMAEGMHGLLLDINIESTHGDMKNTALKAVAEIEAAFEKAIQSGKISVNDLFDRNYVKIANTNPQKFSTQFDRFTDEVLPTIQEPILDANADIIYAGAVDNNGYFPTHNKRFSQPLTGDYEKDMANNRTKRIFDDPTGIRCGSHTQEFLLQTYKRDTGEIMHDLSVPIYVQGRHWGGFRMGYQAHHKAS